MKLWTKERQKKTCVIIKNEKMCWRNEKKSLRRCQRTVKRWIKQHFHLCLKISKHRRRKTLRFLCFSFNYCFIRTRKSFHVEEVVCLFCVNFFFLVLFGVKFRRRRCDRCERKHSSPLEDRGKIVENKVSWEICPCGIFSSTSHPAWFRHRTTVRIF